MDIPSGLPFPLPSLFDDMTEMMTERTPESTPERTPGREELVPDLSINYSLLALAMGFVPVQQWEEPYDIDVALMRGTLFPSLDKPFIGEEAVRRD